MHIFKQFQNFVNVSWLILGELLLFPIKVINISVAVHVLILYYDLLRYKLLFLVELMLVVLMFYITILF